MFKALSGDVDFSKEMNGTVFLDWWVHQLLPAVDEPSVIIFDNASHHNVRVEETVAPTLNSQQQVMIDYTPGIYADGYIVFAFPFVHSSVRMFVRSFVRGICVKVLR